MNDLIRIIILIIITLATKGIVGKVKNDAKPKRHSAAKRQANRTAKQQPVARTQAVQTAPKKRGNQQHALLDSFKAITRALQLDDNSEAVLSKQQPPNIRTETIQSPISQSSSEQQSQKSSADMTFEEQIAMIESNYNQFSAFLDTAVEELLPSAAGFHGSEQQVAKVRQRKAKPMVATNLNDIEQGIIMATVLEKGTRPRLPYARKKGGV